mmetsp:Transcript_13611/g.38993  ORF Transcript_13611/g.38993 Transcript_13611/m.38993 type:complete len:377 (+) Transcript_13611:142-1272(+)
MTGDFRPTPSAGDSTGFAFPQASHVRFRAALCRVHSWQFHPDSGLVLDSDLATATSIKTVFDTAASASLALNCEVKSDGGRVEPHTLHLRFRGRFNSVHAEQFHLLEAAASLLPDADAVAAALEMFGVSVAMVAADISALSSAGTDFTAADRSKAVADASALELGSDGTLGAETLPVPAGADSMADADVEADLASAASTNANASSPLAAADAALSLSLISGKPLAAVPIFLLFSSFLLLLAVLLFDTALLPSSSDDDDDDGLPKPTPTRLILLVAFCLDLGLDLVVDFSVLLLSFICSISPVLSPPSRVSFSTIPASSSSSPWEDHSTGENDGIGGFLLLLVPIAFLFPRLAGCLLLPPVLLLAADCKLPAEAMLS